MAKFKKAFLFCILALFAVCLCTSFAACGNKQQQAEQNGNEDNSRGIYTRLTFSLDSEDGQVWVMAKNTFTLFPSTVAINLELYNCATYQEDYTKMTLAATNYVSDLDQGETLTTTASTGGKKSYWKARAYYKVDNNGWQEYLSETALFGEDEKKETVTGNFYTVTEAYEKGYLTREQVMSIAYYHSEEYSFLEKDEKISDENYTPLPLTPKQLSAEMENAIKQTYFNYINAKSEVEIRSISYYGTYNDCVAVMIEAYIGYACVFWTEKIDDVSINYCDGLRILVWVNNENEIEELKTKYLQTYLIADYPNATCDDVTILKYYGKYGDSYVALMSDGYYEYLCYETQETINGLVFTYGSNNTVKVLNGSQFYNLKEAYLNSILSMDDLRKIHNQFPSPIEGATEVNGEPIEDNITNKVNGQFYTLEKAYENGWLNEDDLKSIACRYYELFQLDKYSEYENPYAGMFDPHEELSKAMENEIKQAYLDKIRKSYFEEDEDLELSIDAVKINRYYGVYGGNAVVGIKCDYIMVDISDEAFKEKYEIGGVVFYKYWEGYINVYHID